MQKGSVWGTVVVVGCLLSVIGFFLPWGPGGPAFTGGLTTTAWGAKMKNSAGQPASLGGGVELLPDETIYWGPRRSAKIVAPDGTTRAIVGSKFQGKDMGFSAYGNLVLSLIAVALAIVGMKANSPRFVKISLIAATGIALLLPLGMVVRRILPITRRGESLSMALEIFAPFGTVSFCSGLILVVVGTCVGLLGAVLFSLTRTTSRQPVS